MANEEGYLNQLKYILANGRLKIDRTGTGTLSVFGLQNRYDLSTFPLFTTKRMFWRGIVEELLWFLKGSTNSLNLSKKSVHIWDAYGSKSNLNRLGFNHREEGDLGPIYGFQWRHFGANYINCHTNYEGQGIDQLQIIITKLKTNPNDRRILMTAWNPSDIDQAVLPPCHVLCQFYAIDNILSCQCYQRSADMGLGVPFNVASYALLTYLIAQAVDMKPGEFIHTLGDAHIYLDHIKAIKEQLTRSIKPSPVVILKKKSDNLCDFKFEDFELLDYNPHPAISLDLSI
ncbi:thymidylate synthase [lymphocystis disease virus-China]|uniref:thymidylate synthase n=2 Tax=Lymphocystis disease virus 2 TaxID=159183 RepID=A0A6F8WZJ5_9VIRU|nr:thymidylate synthase [lymphocystis disease virus-China]AAU10859.1 thymidylate synthase [lymphocystis disease virus-China]BCB67417.1 thymidylate synthase [Lymphocystis disease virus 2]